MAVPQLHEECTTGAAPDAGALGSTAPAAAAAERRLNETCGRRFLRALDVSQGQALRPGSAQETQAGRWPVARTAGLTSASPAGLVVLYTSARAQSCCCQGEPATFGLHGNGCVAEPTSYSTLDQLAAHLGAITTLLGSPENLPRTVSHWSIKPRAPTAVAPTRHPNKARSESGCMQASMRCRVGCAEVLPDPAAAPLPPPPLDRRREPAGRHPSSSSLGRQRGHGALHPGGSGLEPAEPGDGPVGSA